MLAWEEQRSRLDEIALNHGRAVANAVVVAIAFAVPAAEYLLDIHPAMKSPRGFGKEGKSKIPVMEVCPLEMDTLIEQGKCIAQARIGTPGRNYAVAGPLDCVLRKAYDLLLAVDLQRWLMAGVIRRAALALGPQQRTKHHLDFSALTMN